MKYDVAVIGAGAAGLSAARALSGAGKSVCILEARPRIGGRIHTLHLPQLPLPVELGAEFIHGESATTFSIVDAAALIACQLPDNHWSSRDGRWTLVEDFWGEIDKVRAKIRPRKRDISFDAFLRARRDIPPRLRELARTFVEGYHAAHADRISAEALRAADSEQEQDEPAGNLQFRVPDGQDRLAEWLRAGFDPQRVTLRLGTVVSRVTWSRGSARLSCRIASSGREEDVRASRVLFTIPIGVWKAAKNDEGAIALDPEVPAKQRAIDKLESGHVVKITLQFRERFWDEPDFIASRASGRALQRGTPLNFVHAADVALPTWWTTAPLRSPLLVGWAGGHAADALLAEGGETMNGRALDALSSAFAIPRRKLDALLVGAWTHDWQRDPFARCAYSYAGVGGSNAHRELARPVENTLFFAGEATSSDETGTVAGAIESGRRAAREIIG